MSDQQLDTLRNKISQAQTEANEIFELYKSITSNEDLQQMDQQLHEVNKAIINLQNAQTPVPDALREIKNQITNKLVVKSEADQLMSSFKEALSALFISISPTKKRKSKGGYSKLDETESLDVALGVFAFVMKDHYKFSKAIATVAKKHGISGSAVRIKCSRFIGLNSNIVINHLSGNHQALINHLLKTFPGKESYIKSKLGV